MNQQPVLSLTRVGGTGQGTRGGGCHSPALPGLTAAVEARGGWGTALGWAPCGGGGGLTPGRCEGGRRTGKGPGLLRVQVRPGGGWGHRVGGVQGLHWVVEEGK